VGFSSFDDFISKISGSGKFWRQDWNKLTHPVTAAVAGEWSCLFHQGGNPTNGVLNGGTNLSFQSLCDQSPGALLHNGNVEPGGDTKHIFGASAGSAAATSMPAVAMLVDLLGYYPRNNLTVTGDVATINSATFTADAGTDRITHAAYDSANFTKVQFSTTGTLPAPLAPATSYFTRRFSAGVSDVYPSFADAVAGTNKIDLTTTGTGTHTMAALLPRYEDGAGVDVFTTVTTVLGAGTPNHRITYTDPDGVAGKLTPGTLPISKTAAAVGLIDYSGTGAGKYGPFMPRAAGGRGVRSIEQTNLSATHASGALAYVLARPLLTMPMAAIGVMTERDTLNQVPSLPRVHDGACLAWLLYNGAATPANSGFFGHLDLGWG